MKDGNDPGRGVFVPPEETRVVGHKPLGADPEPPALPLFPRDSSSRVPQPPLLSGEINSEQENTHTSFIVGGRSIPGEEHLKNSIQPYYVRDVRGHVVLDKETGKPVIEESKDDPFFGNEDAMVSEPEKGLFVVADGVGGMVDGQKASTSVEEYFQVNGGEVVVPDFPGSSMNDAAKNWMSRTMNNLNTKVYQDMVQDKGGDARYLSNRDRRGVAVVVSKVYHNYDSQPLLALGVVGDCRAYIFEDGNLRRVTDDNVTRPEGLGNIDVLDELSSEDCRIKVMEEVHGFGQSEKSVKTLLSLRKTITQSLGSEEMLRLPPEIHVGIKLKKDTIILLCSDGISDNLSRPEMEEVIRQAKSLKEASDLLVEKAREVARIDGPKRSGRGKDDDMTVLVVRVSDTTKVEDLAEKYDGAQFLEK